MTERDALLRAILLDPADDTVRLAYADWLDEQPLPNKPCPTWKNIRYGNGSTGYRDVPHDDCPDCNGSGTVPDAGNAERAEFIRVQCEIARLCEAHRRGIATAEDTARQRALFDRENELGRTVYPAVVHPIYDWLATLGIDPFGCVYNRGGWLAELRLPLSAFTEDAARAVFAAHPVTRVVLSDTRPARLTPNGVYWWFSRSHGLAVEQPSLPDELFFAIPGTHPNVGQPFPTPEMADEWLSARCVAWGRSLVGLPPL